MGVGPMLKMRGAHPKTPKNKTATYLGSSFVYGGWMWGPYTLKMHGAHSQNNIATLVAVLFWGAI